MLPLSGKEFFLSDGTYDFSVTFESNGVPLVSNMTRDVTEDCVLSIDEAASSCVTLPFFGRMPSRGSALYP